MLGEFNRKPAERRAVDPGEETLDHAWRDDLDAAQAGHLRRIQQIDAPDVSHAWRKLMSGGLSGVEDSNSSVIPVSQRQRHCSQSLRSVPVKRRPGMVPAPCAVGRTSLMLATLAFFSLLTVSGRAPTPQPASSSYRPRIEVWTNRGDDPYASGQAARVYFRTEQDAYVTILRVDTDGRVRVLYPREPWDDNFARGGREYDVLQRSSPDAFYVDDYPGMGYIFAVAAADPFVYDAIKSEDHWDYRLIADGRVRGDPYTALTDLAQRIVPDGYADWDYDIVPYYVQQHYDYPRFLCYDCHTYVSYPYWSPYDYSCVRFRIVMYDDRSYYPFRYSGGTRVVFTRPLRPEPRFIFKDRPGSSLFITRVPQRPVNDDRPRDVGVRGRDLGSGTIPPPRVQPRPRPLTGGDVPVTERPRQPPLTGDPPRSDDDGIGRRRPDHPEHPEHPDHPDHPDQPDHPGRRDRPGQSDAPSPPERRERPERPVQEGRPEVFRPDRPRTEPPAVVAPERPRGEPRRPAETWPHSAPA